MRGFAVLYVTTPPSGLVRRAPWGIRAVAVNACDEVRAGAPSRLSSPQSVRIDPQVNLTWSFAIDRGGTFTDVIAAASDGRVLVDKLLAEDPGHYSDAALEGIARVIARHGGSVTAVRMGTTVATNALLERRGERVALLTTRGFADVLRIGTQARPDIFARHIVLPAMLYDRVVEIDERVGAGQAGMPSTRAAFQISSSMPRNPASIRAMTKPVPCQMPAITMAYITICRFAIQSKLKLVQPSSRTECCSPYSGDMIQAQTWPVTTKDRANGYRNIVRNTPSARIF